MRRPVICPLTALCLPLLGCSDLDTCQRAEEHTFECLHPEEPVATHNREGPVCEGISECEAECVRDADCDAVKGVFGGGKPSSGSAALLTCIGSCSAAK